MKVKTVIILLALLTAMDVLSIGWAVFIFLAVMALADLS